MMIEKEEPKARTSVFVRMMVKTRLRKNHQGSPSGFEFARAVRAVIIVLLGRQEPNLLFASEVLAAAAVPAVVFLPYGFFVC